MMSNSKVVIRPVATVHELAAAWDLIGAQFTPPLTRADRRFAELGGRFERDRSLMLVAEDRGRLVGGALAFRSSRSAVTLRILGLDPGVRKTGLGRRLIEALEEAARRLGVRTISLGADEAVGFY